MQTRFNLYQRVWLAVNNDILERTVFGVAIEHGTDKIVYSYDRMPQGLGSSWTDAANAFATIEEAGHRLIMQARDNYDGSVEKAAAAMEAAQKRVEADA